MTWKMKNVNAFHVDEYGGIRNGSTSAQSRNVSLSPGDIRKCSCDWAINRRVRKFYERLQLASSTLWQVGRVIIHSCLA